MVLFPHIQFLSALFVGLLATICCSIWVLGENYLKVNFAGRGGRPTARLSVEEAKFQVHENAFL